MAIIKKLANGSTIIFSLALKTDTPKKRLVHVTKFGQTVMF
jgi:hypothetical protein